MRIILGSNSPRRRELLAGLDVEFTVDTGNSFVERTDPSVPAEEVPMLMARGKSLGFHRPLDDDEILITADTVVLLDGQALGKPSGREDAVRMLRSLSGRSHVVRTAVCIRTRSSQTEFTDDTTVHFSPMADAEIERYVDKYRPFDKAGAYAIQEWTGYAAIDRIEGSQYNVMGFPVSKVYRALKSLGI